MLKKLFKLFALNRDGIKKVVYNLARLCPPITMLIVYRLCVIHAGYRIYKKAKHAHGRECVVIRTVFLGTGDYYLIALYLKKWLEQKGKEGSLHNAKEFNYQIPRQDGRSITNHVLMVFGDAEQKATELFPYLNIMRVKRLLAVPTDMFVALLGGLADCKFFHLATATHGICNRRSFLQGYRGISITDYYTAMFNSPPCLDAPQFEPFNSKVKPNTILISPYTTGNMNYSPGLDWWVELVKGLQGGKLEESDATISQILQIVGVNKQSNILTNCAPGEQPIEGTEPIFLHYKHLVPYLNKCHAFIGIRSGLCEIVSRAKCRKVILYSMNSEWYAPGMMASYTGLSGLGKFEELLWI